MKRLNFKANFAVLLLLGGLIGHGLTLITAGTVAAQAIGQQGAPAGLMNAEQAIQRVFTVFNLDVDERAGSAMAARTAAMRKAESEAFWRLLRKIAPEDQLARLGEIAPETISGMVAGIVVRNERSSARRYLASLDISFAPDKVRQMLGLAGIEYSEVNGGPVILLPVWVDAGTRTMFEENPWRQAVLASDFSNRLMEYRLPTLGFRDRILLSGAEKQPDWDARRMEALEDRFGVANILLLTARPERGIGDQQAVTFGWADPRGSMRAGEGRLDAADGEDMTALLSRAVDVALGRIDGEWKQRTLTRFGAINRFDVAVMAHTPEQWADLTRRIKSLPIVRDIEIRRLSVPVSHITILYAGSPEQLRLVVKSVDLALVEEYDGWRLLPAGNASGATGSAETTQTTEGAETTRIQGNEK